MILIRFPSEDAKDRALEILLGQYRLKSWQSGEMLLPEEALPLLARENVPFTFEGIEGYERIQETLSTSNSFRTSRKSSRSVCNNLNFG